MRACSPRPRPGGMSKSKSPPERAAPKPARGPALRPGMTIAIEPMITSGDQKTYIHEDDWTVATKDGGDGAHWEHSVAVHSKGIWVLTAVDGGVEGLKPFGITPISLD